jgi:hypothetical protein
MKRPREINRLSRFKKSVSTGIDLDFLAEIAISLWRVERALKKEFNEMGDLETKRTWKHLQRLLSTLNNQGLVIQDKTGEIYDEGMSLRVVSAEEREDLERKLIIETVTPTVFLRKNIIRAGEVVIGKPVGEKVESQTNRKKRNLS